MYRYVRLIQYIVSETVWSRLLLGVVPHGVLARQAVLGSLSNIVNPISSWDWSPILTVFAYAIHYALSEPNALKILWVLWLAALAAALNLKPALPTFFWLSTWFIPSSLRSSFATLCVRYLKFPSSSGSSGALYTCAPLWHTEYKANKPLLHVVCKFCLRGLQILVRWHLHKTRSVHVFVLWVFAVNQFCKSRSVAPPCSEDAQIEKCQLMFISCNVFLLTGEGWWDVQKLVGQNLLFLV